MFSSFTLNSGDSPGWLPRELRTIAFEILSVLKLDQGLGGVTYFTNKTRKNRLKKKLPFSIFNASDEWKNPRPNLKNFKFVESPYFGLEKNHKIFILQK